MSQPRFRVGLLFAYPLTVSPKPDRGLLSYGYVRWRLACVLIRDLPSLVLSLSLSVWFGTGRGTGILFLPSFTFHPSHHRSVCLLLYPPLSLCLHLYFKTHHHSNSTCYSNESEWRSYTVIGCAIMKRMPVPCNHWLSHGE